MIDRLVSVIIPTYNRPMLLQRSVQSVLSQSYSNLEVLVIDDASTLDYSEAIKEFEDRGLVYIRHEHRKGSAAARNTGIQLAQGEYIAFNDDDDVWDKYKLKKQVQAMNEAVGSAGMVFSKYRKIFSDGAERQIFPEEQGMENWHNSLLRYNFIGTPTVLMKRECFSKAGTFDEGLKCLEDWDLWIRVSNFYSLLYIPETLVCAYESENSVNIHKKDNALALERIMNKYFLEISNDKKLLSLYYWRIGIASEAIHDYKKSLLCFTKSFRHDHRFGTICRIIETLSHFHKMINRSAKVHSYVL